MGLKIHSVHDSEAANGKWLRLHQNRILTLKRLEVISSTPFLSQPKEWGPRDATCFAESRKQLQLEVKSERQRVACMPPPHRAQHWTRPTTAQWAPSTFGTCRTLLRTSNSYDRFRKEGLSSPPSYIKRNFVQLSRLPNAIGQTVSSGNVNPALPLPPIFLSALLDVSPTSILLED